MVSSASQKMACLNRHVMVQHRCGGFALYKQEARQPSFWPGTVSWSSLINHHEHALFSPHPPTGWEMMTAWTPSLTRCAKRPQRCLGPYPAAREAGVVGLM